MNFNQDQDSFTQQKNSSYYLFAYDGAKEYIFLPNMEFVLAIT
jgi:hypothetical protein